MTLLRVSQVYYYYFKTNINPTEYAPGSFRSMNAWIPALSNAFQHSFITVSFSFQYSPFEWKYLVSAHC